MRNLLAAFLIWSLMAAAPLHAEIVHILFSGELDHISDDYGPVPADIASMFPEGGGFQASVTYDTANTPVRGNGISYAMYPALNFTLTMDSYELSMSQVEVEIDDTYLDRLVFMPSVSWYSTRDGTPAAGLDVWNFTVGLIFTSEAWTGLALPEAPPVSSPTFGMSTELVFASPELPLTHRVRLYFISNEVQVVPEPSTLSLFVLSGLFLLRRRRCDF